MKKIQNYLCQPKVILVVYLVVSLIIAIQHYLGGAVKYNNFIIFRQSFFHLLDHKNLHLEYPLEYYDIFLYHPSFSILFAPLSLIPLPISLALWLMACSVILFFAIKSLPIPKNGKTFIWWFVLVELVTSLHNQQTNPIIAAFGLFTFIFMEKNNPRMASIFPILAFCIKGYGLIFAALFLFYPRKREFILYSVVWLLLLTLLPLPFVGIDYFQQIYQDWSNCLIGDHKVNFGLSIMGLLKVWWPAMEIKDATLIQLAGVALFAVTWSINLFKGTYKSLNTRLLLLAYSCLWVILFNHASESPTYIIAITGVSIFYIVNRQNHWATSLIVIVYLFSILIPTDIYPSLWKKAFFYPYLIKAIPCLLVWIVLQLQLLFSPIPHFNVIKGAN